MPAASNPGRGTPFTPAGTPGVNGVFGDTMTGGVASAADTPLVTLPVSASLPAPGTGDPIIPYHVGFYVATRSLVTLHMTRASSSGAAARTIWYADNPNEGAVVDLRNRFNNATSLSDAVATELDGPAYYVLELDVGENDACGVQVTGGTIANTFAPRGPVGENGVFCDPVGGIDYTIQVGADVPLLSLPLTTSVSAGDIGDGECYFGGFQVTETSTFDLSASTARLTLYSGEPGSFTEIWNNNGDYPTQPNLEPGYFIVSVDASEDSTVTLSLHALGAGPLFFTQVVGAVED